MDGTSSSRSFKEGNFVPNSITGKEKEQIVNEKVAHDIRIVGRLWTDDADEEGGEHYTGKGSIPEDNFYPVLSKSQKKEIEKT